MSAAQDKSERECAAKDTLADQRRGAREALERGVVDALGAFVTEARRGVGSRRDAVSEALDECGAIGCSGELRGEDVQAECGVERAFLQAACYVRHLPEIEAAHAEYGAQIEGLEDAWRAMEDGWWSLAKQEATLRAQHAACTPIAGSQAQRIALEKTCRASCNEDDATSLGGIQTGHGAACSPPGYEAVKDDLGQAVECGAMKRPWNALGTVCECQEQRSCTQFAALGASSERGKPCTKPSGARGFQKVVWNGDAQRASLECR